ncbi:MAG: response regulator transcription factor [Candidatus Omnitrophica bacterium]|jgi:DNA-binding response OmpR family regulator|nr:response regulator transcription factor [Candidatus Omnitrophota bacterium]
MAKKILVVDDEPQIVLLISSRLKAQGYEVISANDGQAGLEMAQKNQPDLMILDLMLPKIEGYKVCALLKNDYRYAKIPIIILSAKAQDEDRQMALQMGANEYLVKPFKADVLLERVAALISAA